MIGFLAFLNAPRNQASETQGGQTKGLDSPNARSMRRIEDTVS